MLQKDQNERIDIKMVDKAMDDIKAFKQLLTRESSNSQFTEDGIKIIFYHLILFFLKQNYISRTT